MSLPLVFQTGVRDEIDEAYAWYREKRQDLAEDFLTTVEASLDRSQKNPEIHAPAYRLVRRGQVKHFPFAVFYRFEADRIALIAVLPVRETPGVGNRGRRSS